MWGLGYQKWHLLPVKSNLHKNVTPCPPITRSDPSPLTCEAVAQNTLHWQLNAFGVPTVWLTFFCCACFCNPSDPLHHRHAHTQMWLSTHMWEQTMQDIGSNEWSWQLKAFTVEPGGKIVAVFSPKALLWSSLRWNVWDGNKSDFDRRQKGT